MSIWNKVLLGLNILVCIGVVYFTIQAVHIRQVWGESVQKHENRIAQVEKECEILQRGPDGNSGIDASEVDLSMELFNRGRVWYGCNPVLPVKGPTKVQVVVSEPKPHKINPKLIVYLFDYEEGEKPAADPGVDAFGANPEEEAIPRYPAIEKARFLGEFVVVSAGGKGVTLSSTVDMNLPQHAWMLQRLNESKGPWMIREAMPTDPHRLYTDLSEEELRAFIPVELLDEYSADGAKDHQVQDYLAFLKWYNKMRTKQVETEEALIRYNRYLDESLKKAKKQEEVAAALNGELEIKLGVVESERDKVVQHEQNLKDELGKLTKELDDLMEKNRVLAQTIAQFQEEAFQRINGQTASAQ